MTQTAPYEQLVFSGGGLRCFWHGGWIEAVQQQMAFKPSRITGSSGGALSAAALIAGREHFLADRFIEAVKTCTANFSVQDLDDEDGRSAHQRVYEGVVEDVIDSAAMGRIAEGPVFQISVSTTGESQAGATTRAVLGGSVYQLEQVVAPTPKPRLAAYAGLEQRIFDARQAARDGTLPDLIRMAATVPPAFRADQWDGEWIYDGGMVNKAPLPEPDAGRTLVLLTKRFKQLPDDAGGRVQYIQPQSPVLDGSRLDFTDVDLLHQAWEQGLDDGKTFLSRYNHS